jgi:hypothetical protein
VGEYSTLSTFPMRFHTVIVPFWSPETIST